MVLPLLLLFMQGPLNMKPGDPVPAIPIVSLSNERMILADIITESLCFVLSTECSKCLNALDVIFSHYTANHHVVLMFVDPLDSIHEYRKTRHFPEYFQVFTVDFAQLKPLGLKTLPALFAYKHGNLKGYLNGPFGIAEAEMVDQQLKWGQPCNH